MNYNKVELSQNGALIDLTNDSVTPNNLSVGVTAHNAGGQNITGIHSFGFLTDTKTVTGITSSAIVEEDNTNNEEMGAYRHMGFIPEVNSTQTFLRESNAMVGVSYNTATSVSKWNFGLVKGENGDFVNLPVHSFTQTSTPGSPAGAKLQNARFWVTKPKGDFSHSSNNANLLDNWCFLETHFIEPHGGIYSIGNHVYLYPRWYVISNSFSEAKSVYEMTEQGIFLNGTMYQRIKLHIPDDAVYSATALTTLGIINAEYDRDTQIFSITANGATIVAAKLELGETQTLANKNSDGVYTLNSLPDHTNQLLKKLEHNPCFFGNTAIQNHEFILGIVTKEGQLLCIFPKLKFNGSYRAGGGMRTTVLVRYGDNTRETYDVTYRDMKYDANMFVVKFIIDNATDVDIIPGMCLVGFPSSKFMWFNSE